MKNIWLILLLLGGYILHGQEAYISDSGVISFNASTPLEDIKAENRQVSAIFLPETGELGMVVLIEEFIFPRALMQEHFNENYMESGKYPKATFRGRLQPIPARASGEDYKGSAVGNLSIHGISRDVSLPVILRFQKNDLVLESAFVIRPEEYDIEVPKLLFKKIAQEVRVQTNLTLLPRKP